MNYCQYTSQILLCVSIYLVLITLLGVLFRSKSMNEHALAGRKMKAIQIAMSVASADTSSWVMISLPAAIYTHGLIESLIPVGLILGSYISWKFVAVKLRKATIRTESFTIPSYLARCCFESDLNNSSLNKLANINQNNHENSNADIKNRLTLAELNIHNDLLKNYDNDKGNNKKSQNNNIVTKKITTLSSAISLIFLIIYIASGLKSGAILMQSFTDMDYHVALVIFSIFMFIYSSLGGMHAMSKLDIFQAGLMIFTLIIVSTSMYFDAIKIPSSIDFFQSNFSSSKLSFISIISSLSWGLGYLGEPHLLSKFMAAGSSQNIIKARKFCLIWTSTAFFCAVMIGYTGQKLCVINNPEQLFFCAIFNNFSPIMIGILFSGIIAAILSTVCTQAVVCSSILINDLKILSKNLKNADIRDAIVSTLIICILSFIVSFNHKNKIMDLVAYAWAGLSASFGPAILYSLYGKKCTFNEIFFSILGGFLGVILCGIMKWINVISHDLYEIIPGFICGGIGIAISKIVKMQKHQGKL